MRSGRAKCISPYKPVIPNRRTFVRQEGLIIEANEILDLQTENVQLWIAEDNTIASRVKSLAKDEDRRAVLCAQAYNVPSDMLTALIAVHGLAAVRVELDKIAQAYGLQSGYTIYG